MVVKKDWGTLRICYVGKFAVQIIDVLPNEALSLQVHLQKDEVYVTFEGTGRLEMGMHGEAVHLLSKGVVVHVPHRTVHRLIAEENGITIVEVSTGQITDVVRLDDRYGRQINRDLDVSHYLKILGK